MTMKPSRRAALKAIGVAAVAAGIPPRAGAQAPPFADGDLQALHAIGEVVLPTELDAGARRDAIAAFVRWVRNYRESADTDHGYGFTRIRATGPPPARAYPAQLAALQAAARTKGADTLADVPLDARRAILEAAIADAKVERLPPRPSGGHIATDLMGFYFHSSSAADLCYQAAIGRDACRGLPGSEQRPEKK